MGHRPTTCSMSIDSPLFATSAQLHEQRFDDLLVSTENTLNTFKLTCSTITSKPSIQHVLAIILPFGNGINGGNRLTNRQRGQAGGFGLKILNSLKDVDGRYNIDLLEYVVQMYIQKHCPYVDRLENVDFPFVESDNLEISSCVEFAEIEKSINTLITIKRQTSNLVGKNGQPTDQVRLFQPNLVDKFLDRAKKQISEVEESIKDCRNKFYHMLRYFNFTPKSLNESQWPKEFFAHWIKFNSDFKLIFLREIQRTIEENIGTVENNLAVMGVPRRPGGFRDRLEELRRRNI